MRAKEFSTKLIERIDTEGLSLVDWYILHEQKLSNTTLLESLDQNAIGFLDGLSTYSVEPKQLGQYIPVFLMLLSDDNISYYGETSLCKFLGFRLDGKLLIYRFVGFDGQGIEWPQSNLSERSYSRLYLFDNEDNYDSFRSNIALRFSKHIPEADFDES